MLIVIQPIRTNNFNTVGKTANGSIAVPGHTFFLSSQGRPNFRSGSPFCQLPALILSSPQIFGMVQKSVSMGHRTWALDVGISRNPFSKL